MTCNTSGAYHMQYAVWQAVRRDNSAAKFDRVEIALIFSFGSLAEAINQLRLFGYFLSGVHLRCVFFILDFSVRISEILFWRESLLDLVCSVLLGLQVDGKLSGLGTSVFAQILNLQLASLTSNFRSRLAEKSPTVTPLFH